MATRMTNFIVDLKCCVDEEEVTIGFHLYRGRHYITFFLVVDAYQSEVSIFCISSRLFLSSGLANTKILGYFFNMLDCLSASILKRWHVQNYLFSPCFEFQTVRSFFFWFKFWQLTFEKTSVVSNSSKTSCVNFQNTINWLFSLLTQTLCGYDCRASLWLLIRHWVHFD